MKKVNVLTERDCVLINLFKLIWNLKTFAIYTGIQGVDKKQIKKELIFISKT